MFNPIKYEGNLGEQYSYLIKDLYELCNNEENTIANLSNVSICYCKCNERYV